MFEDRYTDFEKFLAENKGKRKFKQTVELAINFKGVDFTNQNNRLNLSVLLPNGRGKSNKIAVFASDRAIIEEAQKAGLEVIKAEDIPAIATDKQRLANLARYSLLAQPSLMPTIAKYLGQYLGPRGKMPKPLLPGTSLLKAVDELNKQIVVKTSGKFLPTVHCPIGTEDMEPKKLFENMQEVLNSIVTKTGKNSLKSVFVKLTMSKPFRLM